VQARAFDGRHLVRLESGEPVVESLAGFLGRLRADSGVRFANLSAAGAVSRATLAYWDPADQVYRDREFGEQLEVVSFQGNASLKDDAPFLHLHVVLGRADFSAIAGHLREAIVHPTLEVWLRTEDVAIERRRDPATGLDLLDLGGERRASRL